MQGLVACKQRNRPRAAVALTELLHATASPFSQWPVTTHHTRVASEKKAILKPATAE